MGKKRFFNSTGAEVGPLGRTATKEMAGWRWVSVRLVGAFGSLVSGFRLRVSFACRSLCGYTRLAPGWHQGNLNVQVGGSCRLGDGAETGPSPLAWRSTAWRSTVSFEARPQQDLYEGLAIGVSKGAKGIYLCT